jgi:4-hydroxybenzoate polyprenyltransferase
MNTFTAFIKLIRLPNLLIIVLTQYVIRFAIMLPMLDTITTHVDGVDLVLQMTEFDFFLLSLSTVMVAAAGYIINDYFDVKVDRVNRPNSIIVGKYIKRRVCMGAHIVISSIAILLGAYLAYKLGNWKLTLIQVLSVGALWYYSTMFKKQVLIGNVIVALLAALVPFVAGLYELILQHANADLIANRIQIYLEPLASFEEVRHILSKGLSNVMVWVLGFSVFAFLSTMVREIIKDIEDYEGDKKYWSNTLAVVYGKQKAAKFAQIFALIMIALIAYLQYLQLSAGDTGSFVYFLITVQIPLIIVVYKLQLGKEKQDFSKLSKYMKVIMLMGIVYALYFYFTSF